MGLFKDLIQVYKYGLCNKCHRPLNDEHDKICEGCRDRELMNYIG